MYHQYSSPPPGWSTYDYTAATPPHYAYYPSHFASPQVSPRTKRHSHRASYSAAKDIPGAWYSPQTGYSSYYEAMHDYSPLRKHEKVSATYGESHYSGTSWNAPRRSSMPTGDPLHYPPFPTSTPLRSQKRPFFADVVDDAFDSPPFTSHMPQGTWSGRHFDEARTSAKRQAYNEFYRKARPPTDHAFYDYQVPVYDETDSPKRSRARRASTSARTPQKPKQTTPPKSQPKATAADAIRMGIPEGYSLKNWDPTEEPIMLLGSVFDANSLGKWIYDWTVHYHGASTPMADVSGDLWLLLIKLAGKVKRAQEVAPRIRNQDSQDVVEDFLESGERLWNRFKKLLKSCEHFMWKAAKRESIKGSVMMGRNAGCEFVDSIFGRDRELENTEKLMHSIRLWNMRFDANCEEILRHPSAV
ncbi:hypothetical protein FQN52_006372 [Onygenales sp. PD_12]|nr:hypothetical protein FQN52_006372 [Onygenales sp. PD_12]